MATSGILSDIFDSPLEVEQFQDELNRQAVSPQERNQSLTRLTAEQFAEWQKDGALASFDDFMLFLGVLLALFLLLPVLYNYFYKFDQYRLMLGRADSEVIPDETIELSTFKSC